MGLSCLIRRGWLVRIVKDMMSFYSQLVKLEGDPWEFVKETVTSKLAKSNFLNKQKNIHYLTKIPSINSAILFLTSIKNPPILNPKVNAKPNPNLKAKLKTKNQPSKPSPPYPLTLKIKKKYNPPIQNLPKYTLSPHWAKANIKNHPSNCHSK